MQQNGGSKNEIEQAVAKIGAAKAIAPTTADQIKQQILDLQKRFLFLEDRMEKRLAHLESEYLRGSQVLAQRIVSLEHHGASVVIDRLAAFQAVIDQLQRELGELAGLVAELHQLDQQQRQKKLPGKKTAAAAPARENAGA